MDVRPNMGFSSIGQGLVLSSLGCVSVKCQGCAFRGVKHVRLTLLHFDDTGRPVGREP